VFHFHLIVLDLETTDCDEHAVIEVGAVALSPTLEELGRFRSLVRPDFPVSDFVVGLTGHSRESLAEAPEWPLVGEQFERWVVEVTGKPPNRSRLVAWGNYFDVTALRSQYRRHGLGYPFSGTALDAKTVAVLWAGLSGRRTDSLSVKRAAEWMGLEPEGPYHQALTDAIVTARIFRRAVEEIGGGVWIDRKYVRVGGG